MRLEGLELVLDGIEDILPRRFLTRHESLLGWGEDKGIPQLLLGLGIEWHRNIASLRLHLLQLLAKQSVRLVHFFFGEFLEFFVEASWQLDSLDGVSDGIVSEKKDHLLLDGFLSECQLGLLLTRTLIKEWLRDAKRPR